MKDKEELITYLEMLKRDCKKRYEIYSNANDTIHAARVFGMYNAYCNILSRISQTEKELTE